MSLVRSYPLTWWGSHVLTQGDTGLFRVGPCTLWIKRFPQDVRVAYRYDDDPLTSNVEVSVPSDEDLPSENVTIDRFSFRKPPKSISLTPVLADRSVVIRPEYPFSVLSGEEVTLYVSTPLWIRLQTSDPASTLTDIPSYRPSDTWFGPSTREGELCYASRTAGKLELHDVAFYPHRAVTPIKLRNKAKDKLVLERVQLPVQYLSLFHTQEGSVWTQAVTLTREETGELAALQIARKIGRAHV